MSDLQISAQEKGNIAVFKIQGKLDAKTAPQLNEALKSRLASGKVKIVCDMSGVNYIASAGVGTLKANLVSAKKASGDLRLAGVTSEVKDVLDVLGFSALFTITSDVQSALKGL
ncbi:MAG: STAS domain-containing protein [Leptospiraceae bacterium]|nr:STAS domain-containing protein [Leptospiraceae bacterium]